jgi:hypothetical protein
MSNAPQLHGFQAYYTGNDESSSKHVNESEHSMPTMLHFAVCHFSTPDIVFSDLPRMPPKGIITSILVKFIITGIFGIITTQTCYCMLNQLCVAEIQAFSQRCTDRSIQNDPEINQHIVSHDNTINQFNNVPHRSWHKRMHDAIQYTAFILQSCLACQWWRDLSSGQIVASKNFSELAMQLLHVDTYIRVSSIVT